MDGIDRFDLVVSDEKRSLVLPWPARTARLRAAGRHRRRAGRAGRARHVPEPRDRWRVGQHPPASVRRASAPYERYAVGIHHLAFTAPSRAVVDERARWVAQQGATIESGPAEHEYTPGYDAVFFYDPDRIKLELVHDPQDRDLVSVVQELARRVAELESNR